MASDSATYREYVTGHLDRLRRTAYLLCGDWHTADDVVSVTLAKLYRHWGRVSGLEHPDAYVRKMLVRAWLSERRRPWARNEQVRWDVPDREVPAGTGPVVDRVALNLLLKSLAPKRRAVLVLRYFCDLSVDETADAPGCSTSTVNSQTARALETLRQHMAELSLSKEDLLWI